MSGRGRARNALARVVAAVAAVFWGVFFFGIVDFLTPFTLGPEWADHYLLETGWGLLYLVLVTVPLVVLMVRPTAGVAVLQIVAASVAVVLGALLAWSPAHALPGLGLLATAGVVAALSRPTLAAGPSRPAVFTTTVAASASLPVVAYAWDMARATENPEETWGLDHYPAQASLALGVALVALLAAYAVARPGIAQWLPTGTAAFSAIWLGWQSVVWPDRVGSLGTAWGAVAVIWGVALVAAVVVDGRRQTRLENAASGRTTAAHPETSLPI